MSGQIFTDIYKAPMEICRLPYGLCGNPSISIGPHMPAKHNFFSTDFFFEKIKKTHGKSLKNEQFPRGPRSWQPLDYWDAWWPYGYLWVASWLIWQPIDFYKNPIHEQPTIMEMYRPPMEIYTGVSNTWKIIKNALWVQGDFFRCFFLNFFPPTLEGFF